MKRWKTLKDGLKSSKNDFRWGINEWQHEEKIELCSTGFHCSKTILDAMKYVLPGVIAKVEVKGLSQCQNDKEVWQDMRIVQAWQWAKEDSVALAIYAAELVIGIYEEKYPNDDRARKAIEAAKRWLKNSLQNADAAAHAADAAHAAVYAAHDAAHAADAAHDAAYAADAAAYAAHAAHSAAHSAHSAHDVVYAAAHAAAYAAHAAYTHADAAANAARAAVKKKIEKWIVKRLKAKEVM